MSKTKTYITSPVYYVNASPHIGHAYTQVACDVLSRFARLNGHDTYFLTGTDEHGEKIEEATLKAGYDKGKEKEFVDSIVPGFKKLWKDINTNHDSFIRTTDDCHIKAVQEIITVMKQKEDIYKGRYEGWFCTPCESFWTDQQTEGKVCPDCKRPLKRIEEANYFFKLSKYQDWLIDYINKNKAFIGPEYRKNEILSFLKNPLQDLCISRPKSRMAWGIEIPFDKDFVTYVWFDALINYISGIGFSTDKKKFKKLWPADFHIIGKDILRHHAVYWPIMLHSAGIALPKRVFAHGWWTIKGEKISKSKGNMVDPYTIIGLYGADALRYFLLREITFGLDGTFSEEAFILRFNSDLANDLGNLVSRTLTMVEKYFSGEIPKATVKSKDKNLEARTESLKTEAVNLHKILEDKVFSLEFNAALSAIWQVINKANKYIEDSKPWEYSKANDTENLAYVIKSLMEILRIVSVSTYPFMPASSENIWKALGCKGELEKVPLASTSKWNLLKTGQKVHKGKSLFPRILKK